MDLADADIEFVLTRGSSNRLLETLDRFDADENKSTLLAEC